MLFEVNGKINAELFVLTRDMERSKGGDVWHTETITLGIFTSREKANDILREDKKYVATIKSMEDTECDWAIENFGVDGDGSRSHVEREGEAPIILKEPL